MVDFLRARGYELKPSGGNFSTNACPVTKHKSTHTPVMIYPHDQSWFCHDCEKGGSAIDWLIHEKGISAGEAMQILGGHRNGEVIKAYSYTDENGKPLFVIDRWVPKDFKARKPNAKIYGIKGVRRVLYNLPAVIRSQQVVIAEGEKNCDDLIALGFVATTNPFGAGKWRHEFSEVLRGKDVVVFGDIGDEDKKGEKHTAHVLQSLNGKTNSLKHAIQPDGFHDVSDWIESLPSEDEARQAIEKLIDETPLWTPSAEDDETKTKSPSAEDDETKVKYVPSVIKWFNRKFPALTRDKFGDPVSETTGVSEETGERYVSVNAISQPYLAATLGELGSPETPTVYIAEEDRFYRYSTSEGIYVQVREPEIASHLSNLLLEATLENPDVLTDKLEFGFRAATPLAGPVKHARGQLVKPYGYFDNELSKFIPCANGMLRLADRELLPFNCSYRRRNKLAVPFEPTAKCETFLNTLMLPALEPDDLDLLQRACGLFLIGKNLAQKILILIGTAGGGKGTFIRVLCGIVGLNNVAALRTKLLAERFELGRFLGKTLLYGADVPAHFLNTGGASVLKMLVGGDPTTFEFKGSNERPNLVCYFNVVISCNSRLIVRLEGDSDAWRRRLAPIDYHGPKPENENTELSDLILENEASGVLNWMLDGLDKIRGDDFRLELNAAQQKLVDDLLLESDSHTVFAREMLIADPNSELTVTEAFDEYVSFCCRHDWTPSTRRRFGSVIADIVVQQFGLVDRNDIKGRGTKPLRGWKGLGLVSSDDSTDFEQNTDHDDPF
jgi:P4 family phage/plasmid primase-like protien